MKNDKTIINIDDLHLIQNLRVCNKKLLKQRDLLEKTMLEMFDFFSRKMDILERTYKNIGEG